MAAGASMRAAPRSPAVESFLRNFEHERARLAEVLEIALCYGAFCLVQNFSLRGMSVEELRAVTTYDTIKKRDFFVRNAGISARSSRRASPPTLAGSSSQQQQVRVKPPHSWRDGNNDAEILEPPSILRASEPNTPIEAAGASTAAAAAAAHQLFSDAHDSPAAATPLDELDVFTKLFGQQFIDAAWAAFAGRSSARIESCAALDERFVCVDQRKAAALFPALELPVASFAAFLAAYVTRCVAHHITVGSESSVVSPPLESERENTQQQRHREARTSTGRPQSAAGTSELIAPRATRLAVAATATGTVRPAAVTATRTSSMPTAKALRPPRALAHVQSKLKPELDARREKLLRVKKTQTQRMNESLARARLAEYEAKRMLDNASAGAASLASRTRRVPLADIPTGAAALEIADDFMKSPLLERFSGQENDSRSEQQQNSAGARSDPLQEELYGTAALTDSFVGCKPPPAAARRRAPAESKRPSRRYNGWLGDFGPQHTKTVVSEWGAPDDDSDSTDARHSQPLNDARSGSDRHESESRKFEWTFDRAEGTDTGRASSKQRSGVTRTPRNDIARDDDASSIRSCDARRRQHEPPLPRHPTDDIDDFDDEEAASFSDGDASCVSDPVFQWLKRAV